MAGQKQEKAVWMMRVPRSVERARSKWHQHWSKDFSPQEIAYLIAGLEGTRLRVRSEAERERRRAHTQQRRARRASRRREVRRRLRRGHSYRRIAADLGIALSTVVRDAKIRPWSRTI